MFLGNRTLEQIDTLLRDDNERLLLLGHAVALDYPHVRHSLVILADECCEDGVIFLHGFVQIGKAVEAYFLFGLSFVERQLVVTAVVTKCSVTFGTRMLEY